MRRNERRLDDKLARAKERVEQLEVDEDTRKRSELLTGAEQLLSALFGGRRSTRSVVTGPSAAWPAAAVPRRGRHSGARRPTSTSSARPTSSRTSKDRLAEQLTEIDERRRDAAAQVEEVTVGLERDDVEVTDVALVWVRRDGSPGFVRRGGLASWSGQSIRYWPARAGRRRGHWARGVGQRGRISPGLTYSLS